MTPLLPQMLRDADALLRKARAVIPDAAGLLLCDDRTHARASAALLRTIAGEKPVVVVSDEPGAHVRIERFARGDAGAARWLVAVNMVSEGVDVPRLAVAAYATVKRTDLFFRQAVGRVVRRRPEDPDDLVATVFLPADPALTGMCRARRGRVAPAGQRRDRCGIRGRAAAGPGTQQRLPAARRAGAAGRHDRGRHPLPARGGRRRAAAAARARPVRARAAIGARVRPPRASRLDRRRPGPRRRRFPPTVVSRPSAPRSIASRAAGRSCAARSIRVHMAAGAGARQPRDGGRPALRGRRGPARRRPRASCAQSSTSSRRTTPNTPSGCAFRPASKRSTGVWRR